MRNESETAKPIQVTGLPRTAVDRVRLEAVANGSLDSDGSAVRFAFMQFYRSLPLEPTPDREEAAIAAPASA